MFELSTLIVFSVATLVFLISPGPAVIYIVARSVDQGRLAGIVSMLGINTATLVHTTAAAFGLSALLVHSALAFNVLKYFGAAYLIILGIQQLRGNDAEASRQRDESASLSRLFVQGFVVNLLNPKVALFFLAFLPQFADPMRGSVTLQIILLGLLYVLLAVVIDAGYALLAGTMGDWLRGNVRFLKARRYLAGSFLIGLGLATAVSGSGRSK